MPHIKEPGVAKLPGNFQVSKVAPEEEIEGEEEREEIEK